MGPNRPTACRTYINTQVFERATEYGGRPTGKVRYVSPAVFLPTTTFFILAYFIVRSKISQYIMIT